MTASPPRIAAVGIIPLILVALVREVPNKSVLIPMAIVAVLHIIPGSVILVLLAVQLPPLIWARPVIVAHKYVTKPLSKYP